jgi:DNA-binding transcriptional LysR family regulator
MEQSIDLNKIQTFILIVRAGNITKAQELYGIRKSKLSRELALLEQELGVQLVYRTTRQFQLTEIGIKFYHEVENGLGSFRKAINFTTENTTEVIGNIRLTAPEDFGHLILTPILDEFMRLHPKVTYDLKYSNEVVDLVSNNVDIAIRIGKMKDSTLKMRTAGHVDLGIFSSQKFIKTIDGELKISDLDKYPCVLFQNLANRNYWQLFSGKNKKKVAINPIITTDSFTTVKEFIKAGHGIGMLPKFIVHSSEKSGGIVQLFKKWEIPGHPIQVVTPNQSETPLKIKLFSDFLFKNLNNIFS